MKSTSGPLITLALISILFHGCASSSTLETVKTVDLNQYKGVWFEISKIPNRFQSFCSSDTTAEYKIIKNGAIEVINKCQTENGEYEVANGLAKVIDQESQAKLKVSFVRILGIQIFWGDYWIIGLENNYQYAIVGDPERKYGWILSRQNKMPEYLLSDAYRILENKGYNKNDFVMTKHTQK